MLDCSDWSLAEASGRDQFELLVRFIGIILALIDPFDYRSKFNLEC